MAENTILNLMVSHHALLGALFTLFRDEAKESSSRAGSSLSELTWETKKHFFAEENAIFNLPQIKTMQVYDMVNHLKDEHIKMLNDLKDFSDNLDKITDEKIEEFFKLLEDHRKVEEQELYPKLDKELSTEQKTQIVARINEIPLRQK
jgi:hemerythrin superfamily protein